MVQKFSVRAIAPLLFIPCVGAVLGGASAQNKSDQELPEAENFLLLASKEMAAFHREYKTYAKDWYRLGFDYAYPTYRMTDADIWPRPADKNHWRPRGSHFTYIIASATEHSFLIQAVGEDKRIAYEVREGMKNPIKR